MKSWPIAAVLLVLAVLLVVFLSPYASDKPDGLEYVAGEKGFLERTEGKEVLKTAPLPDYSVQGVKNEHASTVVAGVIGMAVCLIVALGVGFALKTRKKDTHEARPSR